MAPPPSHSQAVLPAQNLVLDRIEHVDGRFLVDVHVQQPAYCPACGKLSRSRHSAYLRRLKDLPWQGCAVELRLKARRFRCRNRACDRKIFAEPIPEVAQSHARWTTRVGGIVRLIGYTAGGLPGSRVLCVHDPHRTPLVVRASALRARAESNRLAFPVPAHAGVVHQHLVR